MSAALRRHPVALGFPALLVLLAAATGSLLGVRPGLRQVLGADLSTVVQRHDPLPLLTAGFLPSTLGALIAAVVGGGIVLWTAERVLGSARTLLVLVVGTVLGVAVGLALQASGLLVRGVWSEAPLDTVVLDPSIPVAGAAMAASAFAGALWRRRVRLLGMTALVVALLYSGEPSDACRLAAGAVGLGLGVLLARRRPRLRWRRSSHHETRSLLAALVGVTALGPVLAVLAPHGYGPLRPLGLLFRDTLPGARDLGLRCGAVDAVGCDHRIALAHVNGPGEAVLPLLVLATLLAAAWGIWHGRRASAVLAIAVNALVAVLTAVYFGVLPVLRSSATDPLALGAPPTLQVVLAVAVPAAVAVALLLGLRHLLVVPSRRVLLGLAGAAAAALVAGVVADVAVGVLAPSEFAPRASLPRVLADLPRRYIPIGFLHLEHVGLVPVGQPAHLLHDWIGPLLWAVVLAGAVVLRFDVADAPAASEQHLRRLLRAGGAGSLSYMATWARNSVWFTADGEGAVAYREIGGVALTVGEPVGAAATRSATARSFALSCDDRGLVPVFYAVSPAFARALADDGRWSSVTVGEDAVIRPAGLTLQGGRWKDVRTAMNRAAREGVTASWTTWDACGAVQRLQIEAVSEAWVEDHGLPELGFTLGGLDELRDPAVALMLALDPAGQVVAATSWLPTWRDGVEVGWTLDVMRRAPGAMNGVVEFLIGSVLLRAQQAGIEFVSLSASPLAGASDEDDAAVRRVLGVVARALEPAYGFASLTAFKAKFHPETVPLVLACPDALALPSAGVALTRAYLPHLTGKEALKLVSSFR